MGHRTGDFEYEVSGGRATITKYHGSGGDIILPSTLGGCLVVAIGDQVFALCTSLTSVTITNGVTTIGDGAFEGDIALTSISFLGLVAPISVGSDWIGPAASLRGHAYANSNFPAAGERFHGLIMGNVILGIRGKPEYPENGGFEELPNSSSVVNHLEYSESPKEAIQLDSMIGYPVEMNVITREGREPDIREVITGFCPRCGYQIGQDYRFCTSCGCKVGELEELSPFLPLKD